MSDSDKMSKLIISKLNHSDDLENVSTLQSDENRQKSTSEIEESLLTFDENYRSTP